MEINMEKVSVIIPAYNVEKYIDQCLESVTTQTYNNLEIIIVDDASIDGTFLKCREWMERDKRIILFRNFDSKGAGAARNCGLSKATGKYVVYIDSDDWVKTDYIKILYDAIEQSQSDYVSSVGYYRVFQENNMILTTYMPSGEYINDDKSLILLKDAPAVWRKIFNREWLIRNDLFQPELFHYEDWAFEISAVLCAKKIVLIPEIGLYYRCGRENSLSAAYNLQHDIDNMINLCLELKMSIEFGVEQAKKTRVLRKYQKVIQSYILQSYYIMKIKANAVQNQKVLHILEEIESNILIKELGYQPIIECRKHICFGSFSLRTIVQQSFVFGTEIEYFGFSSLISALTPCTPETIINKNRFRVDQVMKDVLGSFKSKIEEIHERTVLFIDFLEERNHILDLNKGQYITESEVYLDSRIEKIKVKRKIQSGSTEFILLWKKKCKHFIVQIIKSKKEFLDIILIKNRMSIKYGDLDTQREFTEKKRLEEINHSISLLEDYFLEQCKKNDIYVKEYSLPIQYCFTDRQYLYGCEPHYMNGALYARLGLEILNDMNRQKM